MVETEKLNLLDDVITGLRKIFKSEKTSKDVKLEQQIAKAERVAEKIAKNIYAKTAEAQLEAETNIIQTSRGLNRNNERNITRGKNTRQVETKEVDYDDGEINL